VLRGWPAVAYSAGSRPRYQLGLPVEFAASVRQGLVDQRSSCWSSDQFTAWQLRPVNGYPVNAYLRRLDLIWTRFLHDRELMLLQFIDGIACVKGRTVNARCNMNQAFGRVIASVVLNCPRVFRVGQPVFVMGWVIAAIECFHP
jgi:hypothetical protein